MADLKVDYAALDHAQLSLSRIAGEFEHMESRREAMADVWGLDSVRNAMKDFADNWDRHRAGLLEDIRKVGSMCAAAAETFRSCEAALADAVTVTDPAAVFPDTAP